MRILSLSNDPALSNKLQLRFAFFFFFDINRLVVDETQVQVVSKPESTFLFSISGFSFCNCFNCSLPLIMNSSHTQSGHSASIDSRLN